MKIAILTMFNGLVSGYSLVGAVNSQIKMLIDGGHNVSILVSEHCELNHLPDNYANPSLKYIKITNSINNKQFNWENFGDDFNIMADSLASEFCTVLCQFDVCIMHDILYQKLHLVHNAAIRKAAKLLPNLKFIAFTHSTPLPHITDKYPQNLLYLPLENTTYVCPHENIISLLATQYSVDESACAVVPSAINLTDGMDEDTKKIISNCDYYNSKYVLTYPARAVSAKGHNFLLKFLAALKKATNEKVLLIVCDSFSTQQFVAQFDFFAEVNGVLPSEYLLTSKIGYNGVSKRTVMELFSLSDIFAFPSMFETQGLVAYEAAARGNIVVINNPIEHLFIGKLPYKNYCFGSYLPEGSGFDNMTAMTDILSAVNGSNNYISRRIIKETLCEKSVYEKYLVPLFNMIKV